MINRVLKVIMGVFNSKISFFKYINIKIHRNKPGYIKIANLNFNYTEGNVFLSLYNHIFIGDIYNFSEDEKKEYIILDCGANIGMATIYFRYKYPNSKILTFEPDPKNFEILSKNITDNNISGVILSDKAIWINNDGVRFSNTNNLGSKIEDNTTSNENLTKSKRLLDVINEYEKIGFLKLDIEGAESIVLEDCKEVLHKIDKMFIEYHSNPNEQQKLQNILNILTLNGFRYYIKEDCIISKNPFYKINAVWGFDLQLQIFAYK